MNDQQAHKLQKMPLQRHIEQGRLQLVIEKTTDELTRKKIHKN